MDPELDPTLDPPSHLALILDLNPTQWHRSGQPTNETPLSLSAFLAQTLTFLNSHLAGKHENTLAVIGAFPATSTMLYCSIDPPVNNEALPSEQVHLFEPFRLVDSTLTKRIQEEMENLGDSGEQQNKGLVGAITKSLCHINRLKRTNGASDPKAEGRAASTSRAHQAHHRILVLSVSPDLSTSYIPLMNSIFAAQKLKVAIDVCKIYGPDTVFLQQAAHLTNGSYVNLERRDVLIQYLTMCFLPSPSLRQILARPTQDRIDFRAACFCHKNIVDIGYVCSVCLSIFCKPIPVCSTCRTKFPIKSLQRLGFGRPAAQSNGYINGSSRGGSAMP